MGSKSSSAPAPDPRLIDAQIRSMGIQDSAIQRLLSNSESMMPLQREQMQFGLDSARVAFGQAQADREFALGRRGMLAGVQDRIAADANNFNEAERAGELVGQSDAAITQGLSKQLAMNARTRSRYGLASSGFDADLSDAGLDAVRMRVAASGMARQAAKDEGLRLTDRANNVLAGYPSMASNLTGNAANFGGLGLNYANSALAGTNSGFQAAGGLAGQMGNNATSMYGAQASYKNSQDQIAADGNPFSTILGAAAGVGTSWALGKVSDRRLKEDIKLIGQDAATGLNLYEFSYINGDGRRFRGVMADEVAPRFPDAVHYNALGYASVNYEQLGIDMVEV